MGQNPIAIELPRRTAAVVARLHEAGAVLLAKLSLGALPFNDIWFGGQTMNLGSLKKALPVPARGLVRLPP